jgi:hypothetical protein
LALSSSLTTIDPSSSPLKTTTQQVTDPTGALLHENRGQTKGQFAFTAKSAGEHAACFTVAGAFFLSRSPPRRRRRRRARISRSGRRSPILAP